MPDELGSEEPRIKVEFKKRTKEKITAPDMRTFIGGLRGHHKGRRNALISPLPLLILIWLIELIVSNYEALEPEYKALIPLRKIYWPG